MGYTQPYAKHRDYIKGGVGGWGGGGGACHTHVSKGYLGEHYFVSFICQPDI